MRRRIPGGLILGSSLLAAAAAGGIGPIYNAFPEGQVAVTGSIRSENPGSTFAFPASVPGSGLRTNLRAELERLGYRYVEDAAGADFLAHVQVGGAEVRRGTAQYSARQRYAGLGSSGYGNRVVVHTPGSSFGFVNGTFFGDPGGGVLMRGGPSPGPAIDSMDLAAGPYQQELTLVLSDPTSGRTLVELLGSAPVNVSDARVGGQGILRAIAAELPAAAENALERDLGLDLAIWTADSKSHFPTVLGVRRGSPAARAGLRCYDIITAIGGLSTANLPYSRVAERLAAGPELSLELEVQRGARTRITRLAR